MSQKFLLRLSNLFSAKLWRKQIILLEGAAITGAALACFALMTDKAQHIFLSIYKYFPYAPLVISPLCFGVAVFMVVKYFPSAMGSGIPQAIAAESFNDKKNHRYLLGMRVITAKAFLVFLAY
jgi:H+/Cl- antiporter ClcA